MPGHERGRGPAEKRQLTGHEISGSALQEMIYSVVAASGQGRSEHLWGARRMMGEQDA